MKGVTMKVTFSTDKNSLPNCMVRFVRQKENFVKASEPGKVQEIQIGVGEIDEKKSTEQQKLSLKELGLKIREVVQIAKKNKVKEFSIDFGSLMISCKKCAASALLETTATNLLLADYDFRTYKKAPKEGWNDIERVVVFYKPDGILTSTKVYLDLILEKGVKIGQAINNCRELCNLPPNDLTPRNFVIIAEGNFGEDAVVVLDDQHMAGREMNGILSVAKGSLRPPFLLVVKYLGAANKDDKPVVLVGKGVTFDSGGINLKPSDGLDGMHKDMSGAAAVFQTVALARELELKLNVIGVIPLVENMPSGSALKPNDIIYMMNGKTVEVKNTDAEGRLILADALTYACREFGTPEVVIDVATLTGAACVALGEHKSAIFTTDVGLRDFLWALGDDVGDPVWPLPLDDVYAKEIKSKVADIRNTGTSKMGGAMHGTVFLKQFVDEGIPWVHIDIAPRMDAQSYENLAHGATGAPMLLLIKYLESAVRGK